MTVASRTYSPIVRHGRVAVATGYCALWGVHTHPDGSTVDLPIMTARVTHPYRVFVRHDPARFLASSPFVDIWPDPTGLCVEATLPDTPLGHYALAGIERGVFRGWSLGDQQLSQTNGTVRSLIAGEVSLADRPRKRTVLTLIWRPLTEWIAEKPTTRRRFANEPS